MWRGDRGMIVAIDLPEIKAAAAEAGYDVVSSSLLPPGWAGLVYTPPPGYRDEFDLGPTVVISDRSVSTEGDAS